MMGYLSCDVALCFCVCNTELFPKPSDFCQTAQGILAVTLQLFLRQVCSDHESDDLHSCILCLTNQRTFPRRFIWIAEEGFASQNPGCDSSNGCQSPQLRILREGPRSKCPINSKHASELEKLACESICQSEGALSIRRRKRLES